jgi:conjugative transfer signal peptidase TraF
MAEPRPLPLFVWVDQQRRARATALRRSRRFALGCALIAAVGATILHPPAPRLVWNASASTPLGLYWITPGARLRRGHLALVRLPDAARDLAARRHYLPANVPAVKRVAAIAGDRICARGSRVAIGSAPPVFRRAADLHRRPLPQWNGCIVLGAGELLLLNRDVPDSFDGRYFGAVGGIHVIGQARLIWAR